MSETEAPNRPVMTDSMTGRVYSDDPRGALRAALGAGPTWDPWDHDPRVLAEKEFERLFLERPHLHGALSSVLEGYLDRLGPRPGPGPRPKIRYRKVAEIRPEGWQKALDEHRAAATAGEPVTVSRHDVATRDGGTVLVDAITFRGRPGHPDETYLARGDGATQPFTL